MASSLPMVAGDRSVTVTGFFLGYTPPVTVTLSPTCRFMPMGLPLPSPATMPASRPLA